MLPNQALTPPAFWDVRVSPGRTLVFRLNVWNYSKSSLDHRVILSRKCGIGIFSTVNLWCEQD